MISVDGVLYSHVKRSGDGSFLAIAFDLEVAIMAMVGELMDEGRVAVEVEYDGFVLGEEKVILFIAHAMRME